MSEQTPIEITQILKESPNLPKANEIGYFFMENQVVWAMEEYAKQMLKQLQAKHEEELKQAVIDTYLDCDEYCDELTQTQAEQYYKANYETK